MEGIKTTELVIFILFFLFVTALGFSGMGVATAATVGKIDHFNYVTTLAITPLFLVAGTFFPIDQLPDGARAAAELNPLYHLVELVRHSAFGYESKDLLHFLVLVVFAIAMWRLAVNRMEKRLID